MLSQPDEIMRNSIISEWFALMLIIRVETNLYIDGDAEVQR